MEINQPLVSVAIITYNQREYLKECIESVLEQDYKSIEIVVADDCSTDGTQDMLKRYSKKYLNKFVLKLADKNQGITKNSNLAHFACSGKYIAWMGGDDLMLPGKISKQVNYMEKNPKCTICYHNLEVFQSETDETLYYFNEKYKYEGDVYTAIKYGTFNGACSTMVRRNKTPEKGFNKTISIASDWLYWVETLHNGGTINYIDNVLGKYRRHANNITKKRTEASQNEIDHLNSCNLLLVKFPEYEQEVLYRYSEILVSMRLKNKNKYLYFLKLSLKIDFRLKYFVCFFLYLFSLGRLRK